MGLNTASKGAVRELGTFSVLEDLETAYVGAKIAAPFEGVLLSMPEGCLVAAL